ncbi:MAG: hypothetical protein LBM17_09325, partial [Candidatus Accumulibacter sp.]|nr:hypothetical protein [Accumulibacter sp.]
MLDEVSAVWMGNGSRTHCRAPHANRTRTKSSQAHRRRRASTPERRKTGAKMEKQTEQIQRNFKLVRSFLQHQYVSCISDYEQDPAVFNDFNALENPSLCIMTNS